MRVRRRPRREVLPSWPRQDISPSPSLESTSAGQPDRADGGDDEQRGRVAQRPLGAGQRRQRGDGRRHRGADDARQRDPAVGLDQREVAGEQAGYGGGPRDAVRLGRDEHAERGREDQRRAAARSTTRAPSRGTRGPPWSRRSPSAGRARTGRGTGRSAAPRSRTAASSARGTARPGRAPPRTAPAKNRLPASEIATAASPAVLKTCIWISRCRPDSPAPSASEARLAWTTVNRLARAVPRPSDRSPRAVAFVPVATPAPELAGPVGSRHRRRRDRHSLRVLVPPALRAPRPRTHPACARAPT